jgi:hypothetical protein
MKLSLFRYIYLLHNEKTGEKYVDYREYCGKYPILDKYKSDTILREVFRYNPKSGFTKEILCMIEDRSSIKSKIEEYAKQYNAKSLYGLTKVIEPDIYKKVICLNNMQIYENVKVAKFSRQVNSYKLYKELESSNGEPISFGLGEDNNLLIWMYHDEFIKNKELSNKSNRLKLIKEISDAKRISNPELFNSKPNIESPYIVLNEEGIIISNNKKSFQKEVICLNTLEVFESASKAAKSAGCILSAMSHALKGRNFGRCGADKNGNKLYWMIYKDYLKEIEKDKDFVAKIFEEIKNKPREQYGKKIICLNNKEIYNSIKAASRANGTNVSAALQGHYGPKSNGLDENGALKQWMYYDEYLKELETNGEVLLNPDVKIYRTKRIVRCVETGEIFTSIREATRATGVHYKTIIDCCNEGRSIKRKKNNNMKYATWEIIQEIK